MSKYHDPFCNITFCYSYIMRDATHYSEQTEANIIFALLYLYRKMAHRIRRLATLPHLQDPIKEVRYVVVCVLTQMEECV